jgi:hypothetical protein
VEDRTPWRLISDQYFKKNITLISSALDTVEKFQGVTLDWLKEELKDRNFSDGKKSDVSVVKALFG